MLTKVLATIGVLSAIGAGAALSELFQSGREAHFMSVALLGGISFMCFWRIAYGPSKTAHGLEDARHAQVYSPDEQLPVPGTRQPIFGPNAVPWFVQFAFAIFLLFVAIPIFKPVIKPITDSFAERTLDVICTTTGLCTSEASLRTRASVNR